MKTRPIGLVLFLSFAVTVFGASTKISPDLQNVDPNSNVRVIVQYSRSTSVSSQGSSGGGGLLGSLLGGVLGLVGGVLGGVLDIVNGVVATVPGSSLETLANNPNVTYISPDRLLAGQLDYSAAAVNASAAWQANLTGAGIGVAVIDSGVASSTDLSTSASKTRIVYTQDFTGGNGSDQYGHGTHVAGIIGANPLDSTCSNCTRVFTGIAPNSSIINLRVLNASGVGSDSAVIQAIQTAISLKNTYNIRVINLSLGRPIYETYALDPLCQAVEAAWRAGIVVVSAAGNDGRDNSVGTSGYGTIESPGNDPYVITVGAMKAMGTYPRTDDLVASYSSKGPTAIDHIVKPDIVAPGNHVVSLLASGSTLAADPANAVPVSYYESTASTAASTQFLMLNGTSMATPVVSGAVADMLQGDPRLTPDQVKARLMETAYKTFPVSSTAVDSTTGQTFFSQYDIFTIGAGYLDIAAVLGNSQLAAGTALSPVAIDNAVSGSARLVFDLSSTWNKSNWSAQTVWGNTVVNSDLSLWGAQAVWCTTSAAGFNVVWSPQGLWAAEGSTSTAGISGNKVTWGSSSTSGTQTTSGSSSVSGTKVTWGSSSSVSDSDTNFTVQH